MYVRAAIGNAPDPPPVEPYTTYSRSLLHESLGRRSRKQRTRRDPQRFRFGYDSYGRQITCPLLYQVVLAQLLPVRLTYPPVPFSIPFFPCPFHVHPHFPFPFPTLVFLFRFDFCFESRQRSVHKTPDVWPSSLDL